MSTVNNQCKFLGSVYLLLLVWYGTGCGLSPVTFFLFVVIGSLASSERSLWIVSRRSCTVSVQRSVTLLGGNMKERTLLLRRRYRRGTEHRLSFSYPPQWSDRRQYNATLLQGKENPSLQPWLKGAISWFDTSFYNQGKRGYYVPVASESEKARWRLLFFTVNVFCPGLLLRLCNEREWVIGDWSGILCLKLDTRIPRSMSKGPLPFPCVFQIQFLTAGRNYSLIVQQQMAYDHNERQTTSTFLPQAFP